MIDYIIIYAITAIILITREYYFMCERKQWTNERQKLIDRIQAKDFVEFKNYEEPKVKEEKEEKKTYEWL